MNAEKKNFEGIKGFLEKLEKDAGFRKKFEDFISMAHRDDSKKLLDEMTRFINAEGFECSMEELALLVRKAAASLSGELSDEELAAVAGGGPLLDGMVNAFRNVFQGASYLANALNKMLQELPKKMFNIFPK